MNTRDIFVQIETLQGVLKASRLHVSEAKACAIATLKTQGAETIANLTLALRHIEDAEFRLERALAEVPYFSTQPHSRE